MSIRIEKLKNGNYLAVTNTVLPNGSYLRCECGIEGNKLKARNHSHYHNAKGLAQSVFSINLRNYYRIIANMKVGDKVVI